MFQVDDKYFPLLSLFFSTEHTKEVVKTHTPQSASSVSGSEINYFTDKEKLYELYDRLERNPYINSGTLDFWYIKFQNWLYEESEYLRIAACYMSDY
jgi:hypothetical protein